MARDDGTTTCFTRCGILDGHFCRAQEVGDGSRLAAALCLGFGLAAVWFALKL